MIEFECNGKVVKTLFCPIDLPCIGDTIIISSIRYKVKARIFDYDGKNIKVILNKIEDGNKNS